MAFLNKFHFVYASQNIGHMMFSFNKINKRKVITLHLIIYLFLFYESYTNTDFLTDQKSFCPTQNVRFMHFNYYTYLNCVIPQFKMLLMLLMKLFNKM